jgi:thioredoxin 2
MVRTCSSCGQKNRIPAGRPHEAARCGACKASLGALDRPLDVTLADFDEVVRQARVPVLVDFWAAWCGPCRVAAPEVAKVAAEMAGRALVLKVNSDEQPELATRYQIRGIPSFLVFRDGELRHQQPGVVDHRRMRQWLEAA